MANLKEIRNRITSIQSTMQITSAMKMVSAAKLKRAQDAIVQMRPYAEKLQEILGNLSQSLDVSENAYGSVRDEKNVLILAVTSNRGLCGGFNNNVIKETTRVVKEEQAAGKNVSVLCLGKKGYDAFKNTDLVDEGTGAPDAMFNDLTFGNASDVAQKVMDRFVDGGVDRVVIIYNRFKNAAVQIVTNEQMLPILPPETSEEETASNVDYIFEPNKEQIVNDLIPNSLKTQLFKALLDSHASEHGARMTAMHKATDNADELQKDLKLSYNKARQAAITNEILEIVGGAEALNG